MFVGGSVPLDRSEPVRARATCERSARTRPAMKREWRFRRASSYISSTHIWEYIIQREGRPTRSHFCSIGSYRISSLPENLFIRLELFVFQASRPRVELFRNYLDALKRSLEFSGYSWRCGFNATWFNCSRQRSSLLLNGCRTFLRKEGNFSDSIAASLFSLIYRDKHLKNSTPRIARLIFNSQKPGENLYERVRRW